MAGYLDSAGFRHLWEKIQALLAGKAAASHTHGAGDITSGTLASARLPVVPVSKGGTGAASAALARTNLGAQAQHVTRTVSLGAAGWASKSQTVSVSGVTASNTVLLAPAPASQSAYGKAQIVCTAQGSGTLTFSCGTVPTEAVSVNVVILGVSG